MKLPLQNTVFADLPHAYLVGGSVRDIVRGAEPLDYDVVVTSDPYRFACLLAAKLKGKVVTLGKDRFSVHRVVSDKISIDVTAVKGENIEADLMERDFTINALACDLSSAEVIDHVGGLADLDKGRIKMVSAGAFTADPARLIRAFRMGAAMDFHIEPRTYQAISRAAGAIEHVAGERIWAELELIMACRRSLPTLRNMAQTRLLFHIIPELVRLVDCEQNRHHTADVFTHTLRAYHTLEDLLCDPESIYSHSIAELISPMLESSRVNIKMAILLHDLGKPAVRSVDESGGIHFYGHAAKGALLSQRVCRRLRMSNRHQNWIETIIRYHQRPLSVYLSQQQHPLRPKTVGRFFRLCKGLTPYVLVHAVADDMGKGNPRGSRQSERIAFYQKLLESYFSATGDPNIKPLIDGHDLMKIFGLRPSPLVGKILRSVEELQMGGSLSDPEQALRWVADFLNSQGQKPVA